MTEPEPDVLHEQLRVTLARWHRLRWLSVAVLAFLVTGALVVGTVVLIRTESELRASCAFYHDLGSVPLTAAPPARKPSKIGTSLLDHARIAFYGQGCHGTLPPPGPALIRWATYYHLPPPP